jgi:S-methylmethionine-dependent homocysteine/selenocysteine methylase
MTSIREGLASGGVLVTDGAMGTEIDRRAAPIDTAVWSARVFEEREDVVREIHADYVRAGADVHVTNTFATSRHVLEAAGLGHCFERFNRRAVELCREAIHAVGDGREQWIAGSISTYAESSDRSKLPPPAELRESFGAQALLLADAGVDLLALEMLGDVETSCLLAEAAAATGLPFWLGFTLELGDGGETVEVRHPAASGARSFDDVLPQVLDRLPAGADAMVGVMHSDFETTDAALEIVARHFGGTVAVYPNSGMYAMPHWRFDTVCAPDEFVARALRWIDGGAAIVGGCCGLGPEHIAALVQAVR